jgi:hypothetical protein
MTNVPGATNTQAIGINNADMIVGTLAGAGTAHGFLRNSGILSHSVFQVRPTTAVHSLQLMPQAATNTTLDGID